MDAITKRLAQIMYIPMIKSVGVQQVDSLGTALVEGGLPVANISQQTDDGLELLRILSSHFPEIIVGGGNVQTEGEARNAIEAGARFIFSPVFDPAIIELCQMQGVAVYPVTKDGILAVEEGLKVLGFYPIEKLGGLAAIDHMADLFGLKFIAAGSITEQTVNSYLANRHVIAATGSWMIDPVLVAAEQWTQVKLAIRKTASLAQTLVR